MALMMSSFKPNPASMVATVVNEETGEERKRLINKGRWRGYGPATVTFGDLSVRDFSGLVYFHPRFLRSQKLRSLLCNKLKIK